MLLLLGLLQDSPSRRHRVISGRLLLLLLHMPSLAQTALIITLQNIHRSRIKAGYVYISPLQQQQPYYGYNQDMQMYPVTQGQYMPSNIMANIRGRDPHFSFSAKAAHNITIHKANLYMCSNNLTSVVRRRIV